MQKVRIKNILEEKAKRSAGAQGLLQNERVLGTLGVRSDPPPPGGI